MIRKAAISVWLSLIVIVGALAQKPSMITGAKVYTTPEDYSIRTVALNHYFGQQKPNRALMLGHTMVFSGDTYNSPQFKQMLANVPDGTKVNFDSRNKSQAVIEREKIKTSFEITLLSAEDEGRLFGGCEEKNTPDVRVPTWAKCRAQSSLDLCGDLLLRQL
jgi:hypothetical protein